MRILLSEGDASMARLLLRQLEKEGYDVDVCEAEDDLAELISGGQHDLVVFDPGGSPEAGANLFQGIRAVTAHVPVMLLTASPDVGVRIEALDRGVDDVLVKPFAVREFVARVRALLRRSRQHAGSLLRVQDLELDRVRRTVARGGRQIDLTPKEFALLEYLMLNSGRRITRAMIAREVWNFAPDATTNVVEVYINYLRKKMDSPPSSRLIHTVRGVGYQLGSAHRRSLSASVSASAGVAARSERNK